MVPSASIPAVRQNRSKLTETASQALSTAPIPVGGKAVNGVIAFFMALLSFRGISTPSLPAQGEQRRSSYFNIPRGNSGEVSNMAGARCAGQQSGRRPWGNSASLAMAREIPAGSANAGTRALADAASRAGADRRFHRRKKFGRRGDPKGRAVLCHAVWVL